MTFCKADHHFGTRDTEEKMSSETGIKQHWPSGQQLREIKDDRVIPSKFWKNPGTPDSCLQS
jgi:hypothetical protein